MNDFDINDKRAATLFRGLTFSNFKKTSAKKEFLKSINDGKIEQSCYWICEFICAGHFYDIWDLLLLTMSKNIHLGNPKLPIYLELRFNDFKNIVHNGFIGNEIKMRNSPKIRRLFAEIVCILCLSTKKLPVGNIKISKEDFHISNISFKLKADNLEYGKRVYKNEDPKELFIAVNEFAYHLTKQSNNNQQVCYWFEWMMGYEDICFKDTKVRKIAARRNMPVENTLQKETIWILWELLLFEAKERNELIFKIVNALLNLFCIRFSKGCKKKRKNLIYFAISLVTNKIDLDIPICKDDKVAAQIIKKINVIYKQIKKNEIKPETDYLFNNSFTKSNLEKTISKLDQMEKLMNHISRKE
tara:strand:- start:317 stop:1390 length:1074 start_codon:yes stop_codon:yes gene_type:complete